MRAMKAEVVSAASKVLLAIVLMAGLSAVGISAGARTASSAATAGWNDGIHHARPGGRHGGVAFFHREVGSRRQGGDGRAHDRDYHRDP